ncbi:MAG: S8 family serine peptidase [Pseudomonadota bacterium]|nr:S8 family serine peptidase [Pseudomonadota bacterium]
MALLAAILLFPAIANAGQGEPPVPPGSDPGGVAVAVIDTGVNYALDAVARRLARDERGDLYGYDAQDGDGQPFDVAPGEDADQGRRHGTSVAGIILHEAPLARIAPYRFRHADPSSFARLVEEIAKGPAPIVSMSLGGYRKQDWEPFLTAARAHPELLFVISAGNDGRNIDEKPVYPASFGMENAIVVTSTDAFGRLPRESNWGPASVDISTPGEGIISIDHNGLLKKVSGTSFAAPRIASLAARLKAQNPGWSTQELKQAILALGTASPSDRTKRTRHGWIVNPATVAAGRN